MSSTGAAQLTILSFFFAVRFRFFFYGGYIMTTAVCNSGSLFFFLVVVIVVVPSCPSLWRCGIALEHWPQHVSIKNAHRMYAHEKLQLYFKILWSRVTPVCGLCML